MNEKQQKLLNEMTNRPISYKYFSDVSFQLSDDDSYFKGLAIIDYSNNLYLFEKKSFLNKGFEESFNLKEYKILEYTNRTLQRKILIANPEDNFKILLECKNEEFLLYLIENMEDIITTLHKKDEQIKKLQNEIVNQFVQIKEIPVVGLNYSNRKETLKRYIKEKIQEEEFILYNDYSTKELKEYVLDYEVPYYQIENDTTLDGVWLEREPDNDYDENAIKVMAGNKHIGYIPRENAEELSNYFNSIAKVEAIITGGQYKLLNLDDKIITKEKPYGLKLNINLRKSI